MEPDSGYYYTTFGLSLRSPVVLPTLATSQPTIAPDVTVSFCSLPDRLENPTTDWGWMQVKDRECLISVRGVARFLVVDGRYIHVDRRVLKDPNRTGRNPQDLRVYLLGIVMSTLLYQRQQLPLHLFCLLTPRGALALTGSSGGGKSTLGAYLHLHLGWQVVCDDLAALALDANGPQVYPVPAMIKLHEDALNALGISQQHLSKDLEGTRKFQLPMATSPDTVENHEGNKAVPLDTLVLLEWGETGEPASFQRLKGLEAFQAAQRCLHWPQLAPITGTPPSLIMESVSEIASTTEFYRLRRPPNFQYFEESVNLLLQELAYKTVEVH